MIRTIADIEVFMERLISNIPILPDNIIITVELEEKDHVNLIETLNDYFGPNSRQVINIEHDITYNSMCGVKCMIRKKKIVQEDLYKGQENRE